MVKIPTDTQCQNVMAELVEHDANSGELTEFESDFVESNIHRKAFSSKQKSVIIGFAEKYDLKSFQP